MKIAHMAWQIAAICLWFAATASAQAPKVPPDKGFVLHDEKAVDRFIVQRWVSEANPEVSPAGFCECITVVYEGNNRLFPSQLDYGITSAAAVGDLTGDRLAELVFTNFSGGAHCCYSSAVYSIERGTPRLLLSIETGDCVGELADLDKDGTAEFQTCDATFGYAFCSFAFTPFPPVVFAYDRQKGEFVLSTPRFADYLQLQSEDDARKTVSENPYGAEISRCAALGPALGLIYTGREAQGQALFRRLYSRPDALAVERKALEMAHASRLWIAK